MNAPSPFPPPAKAVRFRRLLRFSSFLAGCDPDQIEAGSAEDRAAVTRLGLLLLFSGGFFLIVITAALWIRFGGSLVSDLVGIVLAAVVVSIVVLLDSQILAGDFFEQGLALAQARGLLPASAWWLRVVRRGKVFLRLVLSFVQATCITGYVELRLWDADIMADLRAQNSAANAKLLAQMADAYDERVRRLNDQIKAADGRVATLRSSEDAGSAQQAESTEDTELRSLTKREAELREQISKADSEKVRRSIDLNAEESGVREAPQHSGIAGHGGRWRFAKDQVALADQQAQAAAAELSSVQGRIDELRQHATQAAQQRQIAQNAQLAPIRASRADEEQRLSGMLKERNDLVLHRGQRVAAQAEASPTYVPLDDGFLSRAVALARLERNPAVTKFSFWTRLFVLLIDMLAVISKIAFAPPTRHAIRIVLAFEDEISLEKRRRKSQSADDELNRIRREIEIEEALLDLLAKRATRRAREEFMKILYPDNE